MRKIDGAADLSYLIAVTVDDDTLIDDGAIQKMTTC